MIYDFTDIMRIKMIKKNISNFSFYIYLQKKFEKRKMNII